MRHMQPLSLHLMQKEVILNLLTQIDIVNSKPATSNPSVQDSHVNALQGQLDELKEALSYVKQTTGPFSQSDVGFFFC